MSGGENEGGAGDDGFHQQPSNGYNNVSCCGTILPALALFALEVGAVVGAVYGIIHWFIA